MAEKRPVKTSLTYPLELPAVATPGGGAIAMAMCPGKRQPEAATGPWDRDLAADLAAMTGFGATALITLMETQELVAAQVPAHVMDTAARKHGLIWRHWPIVDFDVPDDAFESLWRKEAGEMCDRLAAGKRVAVHCRGGRGRSGLVAARLLIEMGIPNADAFAAVRAAQPLAIETVIQESHVRGYIPTLNHHKK